MKFYVGMDVHSKESVFVMMDAKGKRRAQGTLTTMEEGLREWQARYQVRRETAVAVESGTLAFLSRGTCGP